MILVRIDLISAVHDSRSREIGRMYIANNETRSTLDPKLGDYDVAVCRRGTTELPKPFNEDGPSPARAGKVRDYPRLAYNVWRLISRACVAAFPEERNLKTCAIIGVDAMRGLRMLAASGTISDHPDLVAARAWLDSGLDHDTEAG